eukprot:CAMPEP_0194489536 /NCGR_PEP_ID=MMETSP0253-20130528/9040_1 /TAXON_ID=2966 /ORGANISM="Noctiluca scintillans" /LENGTH=333 /DNA_ID=CAMNT_0039330015 /DNA_START=1 /DNA_END=1002 /DNA_ORIENTATION=+
MAASATVTSEEPSQECRATDVVVNVLSIAGTCVCNCSVPRLTSAVELRSGVSRLVNVAPSEVELVWGSKMLTDPTYLPLLDAVSPVVMTMIRRSGVTMVLNVSRPSLTEETVMRVVNMHGTVLGLCVENESRAYVTYATEEEAKSMMRALSGATVRGLGVLHVSWANKPTLEVCIEGMKLEYRLTEDDLKTLFSRFGDVEWVLLESRGTRAQITCMSVKQAEEAINGLDGRYLQPLQGTFRAVWSGSLGFQASCPTDEVENEDEAIHGNTPETSCVATSDEAGETHSAGADVSSEHCHVSTKRRNRRCGLRRDRFTHSPLVENQDVAPHSSSP